MLEVPNAAAIFVARLHVLGVDDTFGHREEIAVSVSDGPHVQYMVAGEAYPTGRAGIPDGGLSKRHDRILGSIVIEDLFDEAGFAEGPPIEVWSKDAASQDHPAEFKAIVGGALHFVLEDVTNQPGSEAVGDDIGLSRKALAHDLGAILSAVDDQPEKFQALQNAVLGNDFATANALLDDLGLTEEKLQARGGGLIGAILEHVSVSPHSTPTPAQSKFLHGLPSGPRGCWCQTAISRRLSRASV